MTPTFKYPPQSLLIDATLINSANRTRLDYGDLDSLAESIKTNGLIHPPVVNTNNQLIAGGRRLRAITTILGCSQVPVLVLETLDDAHLAILEAEENIRRKAPTWQERVLGVAKVHEVARRGAILNSQRWTIIETGEMLGVSFSNVNNALTLARYIRAGDEEILKQYQISDALKVLLMRKEREALAKQSQMLTQKGMTSTVGVSQDAHDIISKLQSSTDDDFFSPTPSLGGGVGVISPMADADEIPGASGILSGPATEIPLSKLLHKGRMEDLCYSLLGPNSVDHIFCDPPYGIDMDMLNQDNKGILGIESVEAEHGVEANVNDFEKWITAAYHCLRDNGFFIFWYDMAHHEKLQALCIKAGFKTQRWPLVWYKTHTCLNQFASKNFTKNFEVAMVCRKGNATLLTAQSSSIFAGTNDDLKVVLGHPFVKPLKLWQWLFQAVAMRGQTVLDPFAGVGSSTIAAIDYGLLPIALECDSAHYDRLVINTANAFKKLNPNTKFI